jgi:hypothetical protein
MKSSVFHLISISPYLTLCPSGEFDNMNWVGVVDLLSNVLELFWDFMERPP